MIAMPQKAQAVTYHWLLLLLLCKQAASRFNHAASNTQFKQQQAGGHDCHAPEGTGSGAGVLGVVTHCGGQQLADGYVHHHAGNE